MDMNLNIISEQVLQRHGDKTPKIVKVVYENGRVVEMHKHNNGKTDYRTIREGISMPPARPAPYYSNNSELQPPPYYQPCYTQPQQQPYYAGCGGGIDQSQLIVYQRVTQRHSVSNAPKLVETKYHNGKVVVTHYHNNGKIDHRVIKPARV